MLDVLIVNYNTSSLLPKMLNACQEAASGLDVRFWLVDNASRDDSVEVLVSQFPWVHLEVNSTNIGFGRANNQLLKHASSRFILLINTDAFVQENAFRVTLAFMQENPNCGVLGVRLEGRDGSLQPSCRFFPTPWNVFLSRTGLSRLVRSANVIDDMSWGHHSSRNCDWVPGCFYLVRREVLDTVGLFDPRFFLYYEEVDHCKRVKQAGWQVTYFPGTTVVHIGGESAKSDGPLSSGGRQLSALQVESELLYFRKHHGLAGLCAHLLLVVLGSALLILKGLIKRRGLRAIVEPWHQVKLTFGLLKQTLWATKPTR